MKSIMEEASSIMEAIQKGWERAGKPQEFSVKVFEDAQTSFFGMRTVKSAKIALFFKEGTQPLAAKGETRPSRPARPTEEYRELPKERSREERPKQHAREERRKTERQERPAQQPKPAAEIRPVAQEKPAPSEWNSEMISWVNNWISQTLKAADLPQIEFTSESSRNLLRIDFSAPLVANEKQQHLLFSTFAHLIMSSLRNKFKGDLKRLKVVLNSK